MVEKIVPAEPVRLECTVCLSEIPESVSCSEEGKEYVHHFCGLQCYSLWKKQRQMPGESNS